MFETVRIKKYQISPYPTGNSGEHGIEVVMWRIGKGKSAFPSRIRVKVGRDGTWAEEAEVCGTGWLKTDLL